MIILAQILFAPQEGIPVLLKEILPLHLESDWTHRCPWKKGQDFRFDCTTTLSWMSGSGKNLIEYFS